MHSDHIQDASNLPASNPDHHVMNISAAVAQDPRGGASILRELAPLHRALRRAIPDVYKGFGELHHASFSEGELSTKFKELIAVAIAVVDGCDGCIASHTQAAARAGATHGEAAEAIGVTFLMKGGPATIYGPRAYEMFCEFADARDAGAAPA